MKNLFLLGAMVCALGMMTACKGGGAPVAPDETTAAAQTDCPIERPDHLSEDEWATITSNCEYFVSLLDAEEALKAGRKLSANEVQALMPRNEKDFALFYVLDHYTEVEYLYKVAAQYAVEDSLDMMEHVLRWSVWADAWEYPWEVAIEIEKRNPEKFRRTIERIWDKAWIGSYEDYRDTYQEWLSHPENNPTK